MNKAANFFVESFLEMISVERGLSEKTLEAYHNDIKDLLGYIKDKASVIEVDENLLKKYPLVLLVQLHMHVLFKP